MFRREFLATALATTLGAVAAPSAFAQVRVAVNIGPPPPMRQEVVPGPRRGYDWRPGYWNWNGRRHAWVAGGWMRSRPGYVYAQPNWVDRGDRWELQRGAWRRGDRDGDGVPNRLDRAPDDPRRR